MLIIRGYDKIVLSYAIYNWVKGFHSDCNAVMRVCLIHRCMAHRSLHHRMGVHVTKLRIWWIGSRMMPKLERDNKLGVVQEAAKYYHFHSSSCRKESRVPHRVSNTLLLLPHQNVKAFWKRYTFPQKNWYPDKKSTKYHQMTEWICNGNDFKLL